MAAMNGSTRLNSSAAVKKFLSITAKCQFYTQKNKINLKAASPICK